jgi:hypothetical protein
MRGCPFRHIAVACEIGVGPALVAIPSPDRMRSQVVAAISALNPEHARTSIEGVIDQTSGLPGGGWLLLLAVENDEAARVAEQLKGIGGVRTAQMRDLFPDESLLEHEALGLPLERMYYSVSCPCGSQKYVLDRVDGGHRCPDCGLLVVLSGPSTNVWRTRL